MWSSFHIESKISTVASRTSLIVHENTSCPRSFHQGEEKQRKKDKPHGEPQEEEPWEHSSGAHMGQAKVQSSSIDKVDVN